MYERDLQSLIRGLRSDAAKKNESRFIAEVIDEIRKEIVSKDMDVKAGAVVKLIYLDMLGYDMSWASFHVVEVMSSQYFHLKCGGYLAAAQSFDQETDVLMLTTNLLKKDMASATHPDISASLNCLSHIVTPALAQDLSSDLIAMLNHSRPLIRKRAVLVLYKAFLRYPEALDRGYVRLREKLEDSDIGVLSATVNVLCELSRRDPQRVLPLAPSLFNLLTTSSNNWMLIKIVKLFGYLTPYEPRLVKKLQPPLTDLIGTTPAISLLYECVHTCIIGDMFQGASGSALARTCVQKLAAFLEDPDQNLKYISLLALVKIVPSYPHLVADYQRSILSSVNDADMSIRMRALDLITAMVNRNNIQSIVQYLLSHLTRPDALSTATEALNRVASGTSVPTPTSPMSLAYRLDVARRILAMCSKDLYDNVDDFEWYLSVLVDLAYVANVDIGNEIKDQLLDVVVRVRSCRSFAIKLMTKLLHDEEMMASALSNQKEDCIDVLYAAAWICGEYSTEILDPLGLVTYLLREPVKKLPPRILAVFVLSATKIIGYWASQVALDWDDTHIPEVLRVVNSTLEDVSEFVDNSDIEVHERASTLCQLLRFLRAELTSRMEIDSPDATSPDGEPMFPKSLQLIHPLSSTFALNAVAPEAQQSVTLPPGLSLDTDIIPSGLTTVDNTTVQKRKRTGKRKEKKVKPSTTSSEHVDQGQLERHVDANLHGGPGETDDLDAIPIVQLNIDPFPQVSLSPITPQDPPSGANSRPAVDKGGEMPSEQSAPPIQVTAPAPTSTEVIVEQPKAIKITRAKKGKAKKPRK